MPNNSNLLGRFSSLYINEDNLKDKWYEFIRLRQQCSLEAFEIITKFSESIKNQCEKCLLVSVPSINDGQQFEGWKIAEDLYLAQRNSDSLFRLFEKWEGKEIRPQPAIPVVYLGMSSGDVAGVQKALDSIFLVFFHGERAPRINFT